MSLNRPYPSYKDSEVEWLGQVPEHWAVCKLSFRYSIELGKMLDEKKLTKTSLVPYLRNQDVQWGSINTQDLPEMDIHPEELERYTIRDGDLLVCEGGDVGRAAIWRGENAAFGYQKALHRLRHRSSGTDTAEFFFFSLLTAKQRGVFEESDSKTTIAHLPAEKFRQYRFAFPPLNEQQAIAAHLNRETARIDALVAKKTRFIELLREKRLALITHAVTKGLDPNVKMKDSDVEWLGAVPEHWDYCLFKHKCLKVTDGAHVSPETVNGVYFFVSTKDISGKRINFDGALLTSSESYDYLVKTGCNPVEGDVLFSKDGTIGRTVVVRDSPEFVVASSLIIIRPDFRKLAPDYFNYFCQSKVVASQVESLVRGAGLPRISIQNLLKIIGAFPPVAEQERIVEFLDVETARIDALTSKTMHSIVLLKERRSALITTAVTGQIDLREAV